jgi:hypothetical protein
VPDLAASWTAPPAFGFDAQISVTSTKNSTAAEERQLPPSHACWSMIRLMLAAACSVVTSAVN